MELRAKGKASDSEAHAMDSEDSNKENNYRNRKTPLKVNALLAHKVNKKRRKREPLGLGGVAAKQKQNPLWTWTRQSRSLTKILTVPDNDNDVTKDSEKGDGEVVEAGDGEKKTEDVYIEKKTDDVDREKKTEEVDREKKTEDVDREKKTEDVDREKKTEDVDREKKTEDVDRETKTEEVDREKKTEEVDRETETEDVDRETETEEVDREKKTEEVDREKKTEDVDRETKTEEVDREKKTEDVDREKKTEDVDRETKTEEVDREKKTEEVDRETETEDVDRETETEEVDREKKTEEVDREKKTEDVDRETKTEEVDREKKTEDVDREKKTEDVDRETKTEEVDREKKTEDVDREKKTEDVDREKKTEDVDRETKTEEVDREKTGSETMNSDERRRNKNSEKEKTQKTQQTNANRKRMIVEPLELDDTSNHKQMPKLPKEKQDVGPKRKRKQRGSKLANRPRSENGSVNDDEGKKEGEVEVESGKEEQSEDVNVMTKKRRRGRSGREDGKFVTSPPDDDVAEDAARSSEDDDDKSNERITDYFKKFRRWDPAEPENKLMSLPDQIPLNFLERKDHQKGWTNYYNNADHSGSFCMVLLTESLTHKEIRGFGNDVKKRAYYQILWEGGVVTGSEFASEEEVDACKQRQKVLELCAAKIQGPRQLPGRGSYTKIAKCTLLAVTESKWKKVRMEYRFATGALLYILNTVDNEVIDADFYYTPENMYSKDFHAIEAELPTVAAQGCGCGPGGDCASSRCICVSRGLYYNEHGRIIQNKTAAVSECGPYCSCGDSCQQKTLQRGRSVPLVLCREKTMGWGLRAGAAVHKGQFLGEMTGEVLTVKEASERKDQMYQMSLNDAEGNLVAVLDATNIGNEIRYVNHCCEPNCRVLAVFHPGVPLRAGRIGLYALRPIRAGEELNYDYYANQEEEHRKWGRRKKGDTGVKEKKEKESTAIKCLCGAAKCKGRMRDYVQTE